MPDDGYIEATPDMAKPLDPDVMNEWEAFLAQMEADFKETIDSRRDEFLRLDAKPRKTNEERRRLSALATSGFMMPPTMLAQRLCEATHPLEGEPTMTYLEAARGWHLFDAMLEGITKQHHNPASKWTAEQSRKKWLEAIAKITFEMTKASLYSERAKAMIAWQTRYEKPAPPALPAADRAFPAAWVMAVSEGTMTPQEVAERWLAGGEPDPGHGDDDTLG